MGWFVLLLQLACLFSAAALRPAAPRTATATRVHSSSLERENESGGAEDVFGGAIGPLPSVSSKINFPDATPRNVKTDLWVVGAGTLGSLAAKQWRAKFPSAKVVAETLTTTRHAEFTAVGIDARTRSSRNDDNTSELDRSAKNVLICFPPSTTASTQEFFGELAEACRLWAGPLGGGRLLYTSSTAVYGDSHGNTVTETFRVDTRTGRSTRQLGAEEQKVTRGGDVMRLAGLYNAQRGPHTYWLRAGTVEGNEDAMVNMLHYEDAAAVCVAALVAGVTGCNIDSNIYSNSNKDSLLLQNQNIFLAADDAPVSRLDICTAALASRQFPEGKMPVFGSKQGPPGKLVDCSWTREKLGWRPKYPSFNGYMRRLGGEEVAEPQPKAAAGAGKEAKKSLLWLPGDDDEDGL